MSNHPVRCHSIVHAPAMRPIGVPQSGGRRSRLDCGICGRRWKSKGGRSRNGSRLRQPCPARTGALDISSPFAPLRLQRELQTVITTLVRTSHSPITADETHAPSGLNQGAARGRTRAALGLGRQSWKGRCGRLMRTGFGGGGTWCCRPCDSLTFAFKCQTIVAHARICVKKKPGWASERANGNPIHAHDKSNAVQRGQIPKKIAGTKPALLRYRWGNCRLICRVTGGFCRFTGN
mmetsp:Transcript_42176/g.88575  ORF Transcript_42176/g.88575 Transcript_42176/m.88575 type:complete len:235 (-) Transcript_42176:1648-2352(-)